MAPAPGRVELGSAVNVEQARVITAALDALPSDLDPEILAKAEAHLIAEAGNFWPEAAAHPRSQGARGGRPGGVRRPGTPAGWRTRNAGLGRRTRLTMRRRGDGTTDLHIRVSDAVAGRLKTYLEAYASPRRGHLGPDSDRVDPDTGQRAAVRRATGPGVLLAAGGDPRPAAPEHGGASTSVVVTVDFATLRAQVSAAGLQHGDLVLGGRGDAARLQRLDHAPCAGRRGPAVAPRPRPALFDKAQRIAMAVRDGECRAHGCDIPAAWPRPITSTPWSQGGRTDIEDGILLCPWHHQRAHDPDYLLNRMPNGDVRFPPADVGRPRSAAYSPRPDPEVAEPGQHPRIR